jgi:acetyl-CoA carboxylase carboxyltransferase component
MKALIYKKHKNIHSEIMPHYSGSGACFICQKNGLYFGLLINPLDHPVNSISVATIEKYTDALIIFKALKLPLLNVTDSPGGDPRRKNSDQNIIQKSLQLIEAYVDYPYPKVGLIVGRCFGGSGLFSLPSVHGSLGLYAIEKSKMGAVSDNIIDQLVQGNIANTEEWQATKLSHKADLSDLVETNNLVKIIKWDQLSEFTDHLLAGLKY